MKLITHTDDEIHVELDETNVEQLLEQLTQFPGAPCWIKTTVGGVMLTVSAKNSVGHE